MLLLQLTEQPPNSPPEDWYDSDSPVISYGSELLLIATVIVLAALRKSLGQLRDRLLNPAKEPTLSLAPDTVLDQTLSYWLNALLAEADADAVLLGICHNGEYSEFGFHFQKAAWMYHAGKPGHHLNPPAGPVSQLAPKATTYWQPLDYANPGTHTYRGIFIGNLLVGLLILHDLDSEANPDDNPEVAKIIRGIQNAILESLRPTLFPNPKPP